MNIKLIVKGLMFRDIKDFVSISRHPHSTYDVEVLYDDVRNKILLSCMYVTEMNDDVVYNTAGNSFYCNRYVYISKEEFLPFLKGVKDEADKRFNSLFTVSRWDSTGCVSSLWRREQQREEFSPDERSQSGAIPVSQSGVSEQRGSASSAPFWSQDYIVRYSNVTESPTPPEPVFFTADEISSSESAG